MLGSRVTADLILAPCLLTRMVSAAPLICEPSPRCPDTARGRVTSTRELRRECSVVLGGVITIFNFVLVDNSSVTPIIKIVEKNARPGLDGRTCSFVTIAKKCILFAFFCVLACRRHGLEAQQDSRLEAALEKAIRGDQTGFAEIVEEHQGMVFSIAYHFLRNNAVAEELAQEVFLHLYQNLSSIQSAAHLKYWLRRVTTHRCI